MREDLLIPLWSFVIMLQERQDPVLTIQAPMVVEFPRDLFASSSSHQASSLSLSLSLYLCFLVFLCFGLCACVIYIYLYMVCVCVFWTESSVFRASAGLLILTKLKKMKKVLIKKIDDDEKY